MYRRDALPSPYGYDAVRRVEIPVIAQVRNLIATDRYAEAVTLAFQTSVLDLQRAYQQSFPAHWTHLDVLQWARRNNLGPVADYLGRLYELYEPLRYAPRREVPHGEVLVPLQALYAQSQLWRLYANAASPYAPTARYGAADLPGYAGLRELPPP